jgi:hypothetical protein
MRQGGSRRRARRNGESAVTIIRITLTVLTVALILLTATAAFAQSDLSGTWALRNYIDALDTAPGSGTLSVDYLGMPLTEAGRAAALAVDPSSLSVPERICNPYSPVYIAEGPFGIQISNETDPISGATIAWKISGWDDRSPITVWMDGRPRPSENALHEMGGFTTGAWENDVLVTYTTHMKVGILRRNYVPHSDQATMRMRFSRHGDLLTLTARVEDPVYLEGPYYLSRVFQLTGDAAQASVGRPCTVAFEGVRAGVVRHFLPDKNPFLDEMTRLYNLPRQAVLGGAETMFPEYRKKLMDRYVIPDKCLTPNVREGISGCGGPGTYPRIPR